MYFWSTSPLSICFNMRDFSSFCNSFLSKASEYDRNCCRLASGSLLFIFFRYSFHISSPLALWVRQFQYLVLEVVDSQVEGLGSALGRLLNLLRYSSPFLLPSSGDSFLLIFCFSNLSTDCSISDLSRLGLWCILTIESNSFTFSLFSVASSELSSTGFSCLTFLQNTLSQGTWYFCCRNSSRSLALSSTLSFWCSWNFCWCFRMSSVSTGLCWFLISSSFLLLSYNALAFSCSSSFMSFSCNVSAFISDFTLFVVSCSSSVLLLVLCWISWILLSILSFFLISSSSTLSFLYSLSLSASFDLLSWICSFCFLKSTFSSFSLLMISFILAWCFSIPSSSFLLSSLMFSILPIAELAFSLWISLFRQPSCLSKSIFSRIASLRLGEFQGLCLRWVEWCD